MKFEEKLIKLRKKNILSQEELAEKLNVTRQTVSKWELGQSKPDMEKLKELAAIFEVGVDVLTDDNIDLDTLEKNQKQPKKERKWLLWVLVLLLIASITALLIRVNLEREKEKDEAKNTIGGIFNSITNPDVDGIFNMFEDIEDKVQSGNNKYSHNSNFESYTGTKSKIFVESVLDNIISVNKKSQEHIVTLVYNDITTTDEAQIKSIKHGLDSSADYEVSVEYDEDGYIYQVMLEDIVDIKQEQAKDELNKTLHNFYFANITETKFGAQVESVLDNIISVNKKNSGHTVTLVYKNTSTTDEATIKSIKHGLDDFTEYEVSVEYDENGYVNKIILEDI